MKKEDIFIEKVSEFKSRIPMQIKEKDWQVLAIVKVRYYQIQIECLLIKAYCEIKKGNFYFLELPCRRYTKLRKGNTKFMKTNTLNFDNKKNSDDFQNFAFAMLLEKNPELFPNIFEDLKTDFKQNSKKQKI